MELGSASFGTAHKGRRRELVYWDKTFLTSLVNSVLGGVCMESLPGHLSTSILRNTESTEESKHLQDTSLHTRRRQRTLVEHEKAKGVKGNTITHEDRNQHSLMPTCCELRVEATVQAVAERNRSSRIPAPRREWRCIHLDKQAPLALAALYKRQLYDLRNKP